MRYGRNCAASILCALTMDGIHDVCVQANEFVRQQRTLAAKMNDAAQEVAKGGKTKRTIRGDRISGQQKTSIAELIVSLWRAVTYTPYMKQGKKSNDSFRPFAAGVLYTFKRGLYLEDGTVSYHNCLHWRLCYPRYVVPRLVLLLGSCNLRLIGECVHFIAPFRA